MNGNTRREFIHTAWQRLGSPAVGKSELRRIEKLLTTQFGEAHESPAALARILADAGAELRHPEIIELDARWRAARIESTSKKFRDLESLISGGRPSLKQAEPLIRKFEELRLIFERDGEREALALLITVAADIRRVAEVSASGRSTTEPERLAQAEIAEWLKVWLQTPKLFANWIELRKRSDEYRQRFADDQS